MDNMNLYCMIYELKGLIESMSEMAAHDDEYDNPLIERVEAKMNRDCYRKLKNKVLENRILTKLTFKSKGIGL